MCKAAAAMLAPVGMRVAPAPGEGYMTTKRENSTDATRGSNLRTRVETRMQELELALTTLAPTDPVRADIAAALDGVRGLLTGNLDEIPHVVSVDLSRWLETHKHLNERATEGDIEREADPDPAEAASDTP
jgi:hypothetical protein